MKIIKFTFTLFLNLKKLGPCHDNQNCIAMHESNGIDNIIALILNDINPLGKSRVDLVLELKNNASKLLLAIMESRADSENAERILISMSPRQLVEVASNAYFQKINDNDNNNALDDCSSEYQIQHDDSIESIVSNSAATNSDDFDKRKVCAKEVGHNIYILCHQLSLHNKELATYLKLNNLNLLKQQQQQQLQQQSYGNQLNNFTNSLNQTAFNYPFKTYGFMTGGNTPQILNSTCANSMMNANNFSNIASNNSNQMMINNRFNEDISQRLKDSLTYYAKHTAQIEIVRSDRTMERIVFPVPPICEYLTNESKNRVFFTIERDEQVIKF